MKDLISVLIICLSISFNACSKNNSDTGSLLEDNYKEKTDWERDGLKGKVKKITNGREIIEYNHYGFRTKVANQLLWEGFGRGEYGELIYKYDSLGRLIQSICYNVTIDGGAGILLDEVRDGKKEGWELAIDENGYEYAYSYEDTLICNYYYNQQGDSLCGIYGDNDNSDKSCLYKNQWYILKYYMFYPSSGGISGLVFDIKGKVLIAKAIPHSTIWDLHYYYNDKDQLIKDCWIHSKTEEIDFVNLYEYDFEGNIIKEKIGEDLIKSYKYKYDNNGNWVERTIYYTYDDKTQNRSETSTRKIEYYPE